MNELDKILDEIGWSKELREAFFLDKITNTQALCTSYIPESEYKTVDTTQYEIRFGSH